jgi:cation diffusion facilitator family transporter
MESSHPSTHSSSHSASEAKLIRHASYLSLGGSVVLLSLKFWAYELTGSQAIFSDAMESIVNVIAAALALVVLAAAVKPADKEHPYGHGKLEFFSAAFEGGLIAFASVLICVEAVQALLTGEALNALGLGVAITLGTGIANALLGWFLMKVGKRHGSAALEASGHHVMSDFLTSAGVAIGLGLVYFTGYDWIDPLVALLMGLLLALTGFRLVRRSVGGLLDEEDREILEQLLELVRLHRPIGIIQLHHVRVIRSGRYHHIDAHAVIPEYWDVAEAHSRTEGFEAELMKHYPNPGELHLHVDPCRKAYCRHCDMVDCPVRRMPFEELRPVSIDELTHPEEPEQFKE